MSTFYINTEKGISDTELNALKDSFQELSPEIHSNTLRLSEDMLPFIIEFSISAIVGGVLWDLVKSSIQSLLEKEGKEIKRKITIRATYKYTSIIITKNDITIFKKENISTVTLEEAIKIIDNEDSQKK